MTQKDWTTDVAIGEGGLATEEAGVLAGDASLRTFWSESNGMALVTVRSAGTQEWYTMSGSPVAAISEQDGLAVHEAAVEAAQRGDRATVSKSV
ncbi:hypothetical protein [Nocardia sp. NPDC020380]|uniref:hypothetical protein n=1 Tax=Nocardia sp. NPDC020380 TaxID=3364309 RepID=UPI0037AD519D